MHPQKKAVDAIAGPRKDKQITVAVSDRGNIATMMSHFTIDAETTSLPLVLMAKFNPGLSKQEQFILQQGEITSDGLNAKLAELESGKLSASIRSEKIVEDSDQDLKVIVGKNWEDKVVKPMRDTLVLFTHRTQCANVDGKCQAIQESMNTLAKAVRGIETLTIAQIDMQSNEVNHRKISLLQEFPTIFLFCATDKTRPIQVDKKMLESINGAGGAAALIGFLQNNAHIYFEPPDIEVKEEL